MHSALECITILPATQGEYDNFKRLLKSEILNYKYPLTVMHQIKLNRDLFNELLEDTDIDEIYNK